MTDQPLFCDVVHCHKCNKTIRDCWCTPIPCPFCNEEFGFVQDWNIHLQKNHKDQLQSIEDVIGEKD